MLFLFSNFNRLSSAKIGIIFAFEDVISGIIAILIPYYTSKGHYPRWISFGLFLLGISLILQSSPFAIYGAGSDALALTEEFGAESDLNLALGDFNHKRRENLCYMNSEFHFNWEKNSKIQFIPILESMTEDCSDDIKHEYRGATIIIALASTFSGCGQQFFNTLGLTYLDNNIKNSKIPLIYSVFRFVRLLAPAIGLNTASYFLNFYVAPRLHPTIKSSDPRWIGRWWCGYLVFAGISFAFVPLIAIFPKVLPRAALRKKQETVSLVNSEEIDPIKSEKSSIKAKITLLLDGTLKKVLTGVVADCHEIFI